MKAGANKILVSVDRSKEHILKNFNTGEHVVTKDGVELEVDTQWELLWHINQNAIVEALPIEVTMKDAPELSVGDHILINHNLVNDDNKLVIDGKVYYKCGLDLVLGIVRDGVIIPCNKRVFLEKVKDADTVIGDFVIEAEKEFVPQVGVVAYADEKSGIYQGDTAYFPNRYRYDVLFNGQRLYCFFEQFIYGAIVNNIIIPYGKYVTVKPDEVKSAFFELPDTVLSVLPTTGTITAVGSKFPPHLKVNQKIAFKAFNYPTFNGEYIMTPEVIHFEKKEILRVVN